MLRALRELDFEHEAGHLAADDHAELRARYEAEAAEILTELDRLGPPELGDRVERGADRAPGEQDVVDEDDDPPGHVDRDLGRAERLHGAQPDVVPVEGDVERADGNGRPLEGSDGLGEPAGDGGTAGVEPDEY